MQILFCINKARKRSFTEVALNSVCMLEENAASAIDFECEFYSPNNNIYEQCICCVSPLFHRRFNPGTLRIACTVQCSAYFALCAQTNKSPVFEFLSGMAEAQLGRILPNGRTKFGSKQEILSQMGVTLFHKALCRLRGTFAGDKSMFNGFLGSNYPDLMVGVGPCNPYGTGGLKVFAGLRTGPG